MTKRLGYMFLLTALSGSVLVTACGDDDTGTGGEAGEPGVSGSPGDAGTGGVSGSSVGGQGAAAGHDPIGGVGNAGESGSGGTAGTNGEAGGGGDAQAGASTGEGGAGGASEPSLVYACGTTSIAHKYCSAAASVACDVTTGCSDCVDVVALEREPYECATCLALWDQGYQCGIDAFEAGNTSAGLQCYEGDGVFLADPCYEPQIAADDCNDYFIVNETCPAKWPLD